MTEFVVPGYFTYNELKCKSSGVCQFAPGFLDHLAELRQIWARPLTVTSCCRSREHNKTVRGSQNSFHIYDKDKSYGAYFTPGTCAIDFKMDEKDRYEFIELALSLNWSGIGLHPSFIHLDRRSDYTTLPRVIFSYQ